MATVAFEAKRKLLQLAAADAAITAALGTESAIWDSAYSGTNRPRRVLWFGEVAWDDEEPASLGNLKRIENFNIRFGVEIMDGDPTQQEANNKAEAVFIAIEAMVRDPRALQIGGIESMGVVPIGIGEGPQGTSGRATLIAAQIRIRARK